MSLSSIIFNKGNGSGLGLPLNGQDHYSGLIFYNNSLPSGLTLADHETVIYQTSDAETLGINTSSFPLERYHIDEFFRLNEQGVLYLSFNPVPTGYTFSEVTDLQSFSNGLIRQVGVLQTSTVFATSQVQTLQTVAAALESSNRPLEIVYACNMGTGTTSGYADLTTLDSELVSVVIGQDFGATGYALYNAQSGSTTGKTVSTIGATTGIISKARVSDNIGWVGQFNVSTNGVELETVGFSDGSLYRAYSPAGLDAIEAKGYIFLKKETGLNGTWHSGSNTATSPASDYSVIEHNRTIHKAERNVRTAMLPNLNSPLLLNSDGSLRNETVQYFTNTCKGPLEGMQSNSEISAFSVVINPTQNVLSTGTLAITLKIVPVGVAHTISITIGFTVAV